MTSTDLVFLTKGDMRDHVMLVSDPAKHLSIEAGGSRVGNYDYHRWASNNIYEFWRVGATT
ncbi:MAG: hypothetical protein WBP28_11530 [Nostocoides sp.]